MEAFSLARLVQKIICRIKPVSGIVFHSRFDNVEKTGTRYGY